MEEIKLKPCPFCGSTDVIFATVPAWPRSCYELICLGCNVVIQAEDKESVCAMWNRRYEPPNPPLTLDELRELPEKEWVWIESIAPDPSTNGSAYYCKIDAIRPEVMFECGYPGWGTAFRYENYGKAWLAYRRRPEDAK